MPLALRSLLLLLAWLVLTGGERSAWVPGLLAAVAAAALSLRLVPARRRPLRLPALLRLAAHFVRGSLVGGFDVARRALHPRLPVHPGWIHHRSALPAGPARLAFGDLVSLMPGSLAAGDAGDAMLVHCLDDRLPVAADLARSEAAFRRVLGPVPEAGDG